MGPLPQAGQWVRLEVPAAAVGLEGQAVHGLALTLYDGRATWDRVGKGSVRWVVSDHLGTPRITADQTGSLQGIRRHDYLPFGEEVGAGVGGRTQSQGYSVADGVRQGYTGYEKDGETGLNFAQARYYASTQGRFTSTDPIYFQMAMAIDPQRLNLYAYVRNNPLKWVDPNGEALFLRGNTDWLRTSVLYELAGGQENFDRYFQISNGQVVLREGVNLSEANAGVQELAGLVNATENYLYFAGTDGEAAADLFQGSRNEKGKLTSDGKRRAERFTGTGRETTGVGTLVGTTGRPDALQPANLANGDPIFAVIAYNTNAVQEQTGLASGDFRLVETESQVYGLLNQVRSVSFFIHESAENREFSRQGGRFDYPAAHTHAMRREAIIRRELRITGGFAGGGLRTTVPRR
jgi:RHS repeat-associated protein